MSNGRSTASRTSLSAALARYIIAIAAVLQKRVDRLARLAEIDGPRRGVSWALLQNAPSNSRLASSGSIGCAGVAFDFPGGYRRGSATVAAREPRT